MHPGLKALGAVGGAALGGLAGHGLTNLAMGRPTWERDEAKTKATSARAPEKPEEPAAEKEGAFGSKKKPFPPIGKRHKPTQEPGRPFWQGVGAKAAPPSSRRDDDDTRESRQQASADAATAPRPRGADPMKRPRLHGAR